MPVPPFFEKPALQRCWWMHPRFLATAPHRFEPLPSGGSKLRACVSNPKSEANTVRLWGNRNRSRFPMLYCDIAGTFRWLADTPVKRLAAWPVPSIRVMVGVAGDNIEMAVASPESTCRRRIPRRH